MENDERKTINGKCSPIIADCLNRTTAHRFFTQRAFFISLRLLVDERIVVLVAPHEVRRRGVAANVAIDARTVHVKSPADVLLHFIVFVWHGRKAVFTGASSLPA
jgi:hypothetical protein